MFVIQIVLQFLKSNADAWKHLSLVNVYLVLCFCCVFSTVLVLIKLTEVAVALRLRCGSCNLIFDIISSLFAKCKNVVLRLKPGETPSYLASRQAPNCVQRS